MKRTLLSLFLLLSCGAFAQIGSVSIGNLTASGSNCSTAGACVVINLPGNTSTVAVGLSGTFSLTAQFEVSPDAQGSWASVNCTPAPSGAAVSSATAAGIFLCPAAGFTHIRIRASSYSSGTVIVTLYPSIGVSLGANQPVNVLNSGDPCLNPNVTKSSAKINLTSTTAQELVLVSGSTKVYVCGFSATIQGSATTVGTLQFEYGTKTTNGCDTGTQTLTDTFQGNITASIPLLVTSAGAGTQFVTAAANELCAVATGTTISIHGYLSYVQQ